MNNEYDIRFDISQRISIRARNELQGNGPFDYIRDIFQNRIKIGSIYYTKINDGNPIIGPGPIVFNDCQPGGPYPLFVYFGNKRLKNDGVEAALAAGEIIRTYIEAGQCDVILDIIPRVGKIGA